MKVTNTTCYDTRAIKKFLHASFVSLGVQPQHRKRKIIEVVPSRNGTHWGCATLGGDRAARYMKLSLPGPKALHLASFYRTIRHEHAHNLGIQHGEMASDLRWCSGPVPEWVASFVMPVRAQALSAPKPSATERAESKLAAARRRRDRAEHRAKLAAKAVQRWTVKVRYYERRLAQLVAEYEQPRRDQPDPKGDQVHASHSQAPADLDGAGGDRG
jgi:hypothetical protein